MKSITEVRRRVKATWRDAQSFAEWLNPDDAKKYKLSGGQCIIVDLRSKNSDKITNYLKPRLKDKKKKKTLVTQKKIKIKKKSLDNDPPIINIKDTIIVQSSNFEISGKVSDEGSKLVYVKVAGQDIPVNNGKFKIKKYSPSDTEIKITAIDEWGNEANKLVKIKVKKEEKMNRDRSEEIISFLEIEDIKDTPVGKLPYGLQKKVELGRALATDSSIILLDEPMAGMNVEEKRDMCRFILKVNDELGTTMVLIEHDMGVVMDISDRVVVLDYGKVIGDGTPDEIMANQKVIDAYLGVEH